jgi:NarL family two-component system response regulator LiaR
VYANFINDYSLNRRTLSFNFYRSHTAPTSGTAFFFRYSKDATRAICQILPNVKIIITTSYIDEDTILVTRQAGAIGFLIKNTTGDELYFAIRRAFVNQTTLAPEVAQTLMDALEKTKTHPAALGDDLTEREREILTQMIDGLTNREIGQRLGLSPSMVKNHVGNILSKLGVNSRTRAIVLAVENKIVAP